MDGRRHGKLAVELASGQGKVWADGMQAGQNVHAFLPTATGRTVGTAQSVQVTLALAH